MKGWMGCIPGRRTTRRPDAHAPIAIGLHWVIALLIFATFPLGLYMHDLPLSMQRLRLYSFHKWIGVTILAFVLVRLAWRATHFPPRLPDTMPPWERTAAGVMCWLLYVLMIAVPIGGWLLSSAQGFQTVWFGILPLPDIVARDRQLAHSLAELHTALSFFMLACVGLHFAAALKHQFLTRDDVLLRMMPFRRRPADRAGRRANSSPETPVAGQGLRSEFVFGAPANRRTVTAPAPLSPLADEARRSHLIRDCRLPE